MQPTEVESLSDREVLLVLSELTDELRESGEVGPSPVASEQDARDLLASFLNDFAPSHAASSGAIVPGAIVPDDADAAALGRDLLALLIHDDVAGDAAQSLVAEPPDDSQMALPLAIGAAVVLGLLVTWLQTKVDIEVTHEHGETKWRIAVHKDATDPAVIKDVVSTVSKSVTPG